MTTRWMIPLLVVAVAGGIAFGVTRYMVYRPAGAGLDRLRDVSFLQRELNLTDVQRSQLEELQKNLATRLDACCVSHCAARACLGQALADGTNGNARADSVLAEMCRAYEESERATFNHMRQVRALLNAKQQARFDALLAACLCPFCPRCEAAGGCMGTEGEGH